MTKTSYPLHSQPLAHHQKQFLPGEQQNAQKSLPASAVLCTRHVHACFSVPASESRLLPLAGGSRSGYGRRMKPSFGAVIGARSPHSPPPGKWLFLPEITIEEMEGIKPYFTGCRLPWLQICGSHQPMCKEAVKVSL